VLQDDSDEDVDRSQRSARMKADRSASAEQQRGDQHDSVTGMTTVVVILPLSPMTSTVAISVQL